jgi:hypothetical protein
MHSDAPVSMYLTFADTMCTIVATLSQVAMHQAVIWLRAVPRAHYELSLLEATCYT